MNLIISPLAQDDILSIIEYTLIQWGEKQVDQYLKHVQVGLQRIADNPFAGILRPDISSKHRSVPIQKHAL
jgi:toxin ParE1/3/4